MTVLTQSHQGAQVAVEELTGLALQEKALTQMLERFAREAPLGGPRERAEDRLAVSRSHQQTLDRLVEERQADRGAGELAAGLLRSGMVVAGVAAATAGQVATGVFAMTRRGGGEERVLEDLGIEAAAWANKLVILTALGQALELAGDERGQTAVDELRAETQLTFDEVVGAAPDVMQGLVAARAGEPSYDMRTRG